MKYLILNVFFFGYFVFGTSGLLLKKTNCSIVKYIATHFVKSGRSPILVAAESKEPLFKNLNELAKSCAVQIRVLESFMLESQVNSTEDKLKVNRDALFVGKGIEFELLDASKKPICNKTCLISN